MGKGNDKIHILNATQYEEEFDGITSVSTVTGNPTEEVPKGMIWHFVLGKPVPESWRNKEMWVDKKEVFGDED